MLNTTWQSVCLGMSLYLCEVLPLCDCTAGDLRPHQHVKETSSQEKGGGCADKVRLWRLRMVLKEPCWGETDPTKAQRAPGLHLTSSRPADEESSAHRCCCAMSPFSVGCMRDIPTSAARSANWDTTQAGTRASVNENLFVLSKKWISSLTPPLEVWGGICPSCSFLLYWMWGNYWQVSLEPPRPNAAWCIQASQFLQTMWIFFGFFVRGD